MNLFLETITVTAAGVVSQALNHYTDELTAAIFYHSALNTNIRLVQDGTLKSFYANIHNESGIKLREERWEAREPEQQDPTPDPVTP